MGDTLPPSPPSSPTDLVSAAYEFEDYDHTSQVYDDYRKPNGLNIIFESLSTLPKPLRGISLLDAGCGTGAYL